MKFRFLLFIFLFPVLCSAQEVVSYQRVANGMKIILQDGALGIYPLSENAVRIKFYKDIEVQIPELIFTLKVTSPEFQVSDSPSKLEIKGKNIVVIVDKQIGKLSFANNSGKIFLNEIAGSRKLTPDSVLNEPCFDAELRFESPSDEYIFGLGQFQDGQYNLKGVTRRLTQVNTQIAIPFIFSNKGYGLLWHQYGITDFNLADNLIMLEKQQKAADNNLMAEVTTTSGTQKVSQNQSLYKGSFSVPKDGGYSIFLDLGDMGNRHFVVIDGKPFIDQTNMWLPPSTCALVKLDKGEHKVQLICKSDNNPKLSWKLVDNQTTFRSYNAKLLDYVVFYGPSADTVIASYRNLSGNVPMFPKWAYGFWQCRERYTSGTHLVETVKEFRRRNLPLDVIVQDWQYWGNKGWGVPQFDETSYPNPAGFINELHDLNAHFNISIWSNPDKNSNIGKEFVTKNRFIPNTKWLDYFNPDTRSEYWNTLKDNLFVHGVDSWWMDAVEPENDALKGQKLFLGPGDFYRLTYPLFVCKAVYEGQRETTSDKRVCILTRSAFPGQQRYGIINWSGDVGGDWDTFRRQIVAGLNYTITGFPYWTTDIGGFFRPGTSQYTNVKYHELLIRWFEWGAFNPIFRVHGYMSETEPWKYGQFVEDNMRKILNLRYRLLPYIYSEAWQVTMNKSTIMRPMVMDFSDDENALKQSYQYMFGNAFLVTPIIEPNVKEWSIYLPKSALWYDFWTGKSFNGGQSIKTDAPLGKIPLFVKAGSIVPIGDIIQYTGEKPTSNLEIRIFKGGDGEFILYEDEGDNYNYEKGQYSTITFMWNDREKLLTIIDRKGSFKGMIEKRKFNIVFVGENRGFGMNTNKYDKEVTYDGMKVVVKF